MNDVNWEPAIAATSGRKQGIPGRGMTSLLGKTMAAPITRRGVFRRPSCYLPAFGWLTLFIQPLHHRLLAGNLYPRACGRGLPGTTISISPAGNIANRHRPTPWFG